MKNANEILRAATLWARHDGVNRWTLGLHCPVNSDFLFWLVVNYQVERVVELNSGRAAVLLRTDSENVAALMALPGPKGGGSLHECNDVSW